MAKAAFSKKQNLFTSKLDLNFRNKLIKCHIWSMALYGAETWTLRQQIRNIWKVLKCGAGGGWRRSFGPITWEIKKCYLERTEWVASTFTLPRDLVNPALLPLMRTPWPSVVCWTDAPADLNGLVHFAERRNWVSARVPSHFNWPVHPLILIVIKILLYIVKWMKVQITF